MEALVYSENEFGKTDGKVTNGLIRSSGKYNIVGIIDSSKTGQDTGEYLDGVKNGIPIYRDLDHAMNHLNTMPRYFIYGIAPTESFLDQKQRNIIFSAMRKGMDIVNGLPQFFTDDQEFVSKASEYGVNIFDVRKPPDRNDLHSFTGRIHEVKTPVIAVLGTDCAVGKRTTALKLVEALREEGLNTVFVTTGQTGLLQGSKYGIAVDVLSSGFATGEVEHAVLSSIDQENPDVIIVEGQGAISHPSYTSSHAIVRGALPKAIIVQHPPKRKGHFTYPSIPMPTLASEIELIEVFTKAKVIAITLNHENMTDEEIENTVLQYEIDHQLPTTDVLKHGCDKLVRQVMEVSGLNRLSLSVSA